MKAVQFGAGNIGRGFIGKILAEAGWHVVFADIDTKIVELLSNRKSYPVDVVGQSTRREFVTDVDAVSSAGDDIIELLKTTDLVTTAVGPTVLPKIAPILARGISARLKDGNRAPLNIIACENTIRGTTQLKQAVFSLLASDLLDAVEANVGFADSAVDRIVPPAGVQSDDELRVVVEEYCEWIVDRTQLKEWRYQIPGMQLTDNLPAFIERKLFTLNTGHAITAYYGYVDGCQTIRDAISIPSIRGVVRGAMRESGAVLIRRYDFNPSVHEHYIEKILNRFANPFLQDNVKRVGREPLRKLAPNDRLIQPLLGTIEYGFSRENLVRGIAAALYYCNDEDAQAVELQEMLSHNGVEAALSRLSGNFIPTQILSEIATDWHDLAPLTC